MKMGLTIHHNSGVVTSENWVDPTICRISIAFLQCNDMPTQEWLWSPEHPFIFFTKKTTWVCLKMEYTTQTAFVFLGGQLMIDQ